MLFSATVDESLVVKLIPGKRNAIFNYENTAHYTLEIKSTYKTKQEGKVSFTLQTDTNDFLNTSTVDVIIGRGRTKIPVDFDLPQAGFYRITAAINLDEYDDTLQAVFGYRPFDLNREINRPDDFDEFWQKTLSELAQIPPNYVIEKVVDMAENSATHNTYSIRMQSLNHVVIQAWLTIPKTPGNFPLIIGLPGYDKIIKPLYTDDNAWLQFNIRKDKPKGKEQPESEYEFLLYIISDPQA